MNKEKFVSVEQIIAAKAAGWHVIDLNDNPGGLKVRGQNWVLTNPAGKKVHYAWSSDDAWLGILPTEDAEQNTAIARVTSERQRQDSKWGQQNHDAGKWLLILMEELGEVSKSQLEGDRTNYLTELVQSAAVIVAWIECEFRRDSNR